MNCTTPKQSSRRDDISPLALWRSAPANAVDRADIGRLHEAIRCVNLVGESAWRLARTGDAGAAIGVAICVAIKRRARPEIVDLVMTAVLATAIEGSSAARAFLAHMLGKRGADALASSWIEANRVAAMRPPLAAPQPSPKHAQKHHNECARLHG